MARMMDPAEYPQFGDLYPICGCCCMFSSCYFKSPDCCGCTSSNEVLCTRNRTVSCKVGRTGDTVCLCASSECECTSLRTVCKSQTQVCCSDTRCALPTDEDTPLLLNLCCITIYFRDHFVFKACAKGENLSGAPSLQESLY